MANEIQYYGRLSQTGLTLVARVYDESGSQVGSDVSLTESGSLAIYRGDMPTASAGIYGVRVFNVATLLGQGVIEWDGTQEVSRNLDAAVSTRSTFDPTSDAVAQVTLVDTTTTNTDMRGTDGANTVAPSTPGDVSSAQSAIQSDIAALNDLSAAQVNAEVDTALTDYDPPTKAELDAAESAIISALPGAAPSAADIYAEFTSGTNEDAFKADVSALATSAEIGALNDVSAADVYAEFTAGTNEDAFKADVSALATSAEIATLNDVSTTQVEAAALAAVTSYDPPTKAELDTAESNIISAISTGSAPSAADIYAEFTSGTNEDAFKADVSGLATSAEIAALNDLSAAQVNAEVDTALADYDGPTKAELDAAESNIIAAIPGTAPSAAAIAAAVRADQATELARIDVSISSRESEVDAATRAATAASSVADIEGDLSIINVGVKSASILVPHTTNLP